MNRFRISPDNPVRRRLFELDDTEEATIDNFANLLQEEDTRVRNDNMQKWNFDFENETPLQGTIEWIPCDGPMDYIGRVRSNVPNEVGSLEKTSDTMDIEEEMEAMFENTDEEFNEEGAQLLKQRNETTPDKKSKEGKEESPLLKTDKRSRETTDRKTADLCTDKAIRRNIHFD